MVRVWGAKDTVQIKPLVKEDMACGLWLCHVSQPDCFSCLHKHLLTRGTWDLDLLYALEMVTVLFQRTNTNIALCSNQGRKRALEYAWILGAIHYCASLFTCNLAAAFNLYNLFFHVIQKHIGESWWLSTVGYLKNSRWFKKAKSLSIVLQRTGYLVFKCLL